MRIWSIHPKYLDTKGLVALWRETLLAKNVLEGNTNGYKNHPQLNRFKRLENPLDGINSYLKYVYEESKFRKYNFDKSKIDWDCKDVKILVTHMQLMYEFNHLLKKLKERDKNQYGVVNGVMNVETHPIFRVVPGEIEEWEVIQ